MPGRQAGSPIAVYAGVQCREPKTGQKKVQFSKLGARLQNNVAFCACASFSNVVASCAIAKEYVAIKNTKQNLLVFIPPTFTLESRNKNYSAPIGSMGNYLLSAESFM